MTNLQEPTMNIQHSLLSGQTQSQRVLRDDTQHTLGLAPSISTTSSYGSNPTCLTPDSPRSSQTSSNISKEIASGTFDTLPSGPREKCKPSQQMQFGQQPAETLKGLDSAESSPQALKSRPTRTRKPTGKALELAAGGSKLFASLSTRSPKADSVESTNEVGIITSESSTPAPNSRKQIDQSEITTSDRQGQVNDVDYNQMSSHKQTRNSETKASSMHEKACAPHRFPKDFSDPDMLGPSDGNQGDKAERDKVGPQMTDDERLLFFTFFGINMSPQEMSNLWSQNGVRKRKAKPRSQPKNKLPAKRARGLKTSTNTSNQRQMSNTPTKRSLSDLNSPKVTFSGSSMKMHPRGDPDLDLGESLALLLAEEGLSPPSNTTPNASSEIPFGEANLIEEVDHQQSLASKPRLADQPPKTKRRPTQKRKTRSNILQRNGPKVNDSCNDLLELEDEMNCKWRDSFSPSSNVDLLRSKIKDDYVPTRKSDNTLPCNLDCLDESDTLFAFAEIASQFSDDNFDLADSEEQSTSNADAQNKLLELLQTYCQCQSRSDKQVAPKEKISGSIDERPVKQSGKRMNSLLRNSIVEKDDVLTQTSRADTTDGLKLETSKNLSGIKLKLRMNR